MEEYADGLFQCQKCNEEFCITIGWDTEYKRLFILDIEQYAKLIQYTKWSQFTLCDECRND